MSGRNQSNEIVASGINHNYDKHDQLGDRISKKKKKQRRMTEKERFARHRGPDKK